MRDLGQHMTTCDLLKHCDHDAFLFLHTLLAPRDLISLSAPNLSYVALLDAQCHPHNLVHSWPLVSLWAISAVLKNSLCYPCCSMPS